MCIALLVEVLFDYGVFFRTHEECLFCGLPQPLKLLESPPLNLFPPLFKGGLKKGFPHWLLGLGGQGRPDMAFTWSMNSLDCLAKSVPKSCETAFIKCSLSLARGERVLLAQVTIFFLLRREILAFALPISSAWIKTAWYNC